MPFILSIATDNAAFSDDDDAAEGEADAAVACRREVARILREVAHRVEHCQAAAGSMRDCNGNIVGTWELTP